MRPQVEQVREKKNDEKTEIQHKWKSRIQNNDSKDAMKTWKQNGENARNI